MGQDGLRGFSCRELKEEIDGDVFGEANGRRMGQDGHFDRTSALRTHDGGRSEPLSRTKRTKT
jgi:hypothetical protein